MDAPGRTTSPDGRTVYISGVTQIDLRQYCDHTTERLVIRNCSLDELDLSPLRDCPNIRALEVRNNGLRHLDLLPVKDLPRFERIDIGQSEEDTHLFESIDVTPLLLLSRVSMGLSGYLIDDIEFTSVFRVTCEHWHHSGPRSLYEKSRLLSVDESIDRYGWGGVVELFLEAERRIGPTVTNRIFLQADLLTAMGLKAYLGFDGDVLRFLRQHRGLDYRSFRRKLEEYLREGVKKQVERGGSTVLLDIECLQKDPDMARLVPRILQLRKQEVSDIVLCRINDDVDLTPLYVTEYGFRVLSSMDYHLRSIRDPFHRTHGLVVYRMNEDYEEVMNALGKAGIGVRYTDRPYEAEARLKEISEPFLRYVLTLGTQESEHSEWNYEEDERRGVAFRDLGWGAFSDNAEPE